MLNSYKFDGTDDQGGTTVNRAYQLRLSNLQILCSAESIQKIGSADRKRKRTPPKTYNLLPSTGITLTSPSKRARTKLVDLIGNKGPEAGDDTEMEDILDPLKASTPTGNTAPPSPLTPTTPTPIRTTVSSKKGGNVGHKKTSRA